MSVKFDGDLKTLVHDLETRGYRVRKSETIAGAPGRTADVLLDNGAVVQWDAYSQRIWASGSTTASRRTETFLRCLYEGGLLGRFWIFTICHLTRSIGYICTKLLLVKKVASAQAIPKVSLPSKTIKDATSTRPQRPVPFSIV